MNEQILAFDFDSGEVVDKKEVVKEVVKKEPKQAKTAKQSKFKGIKVMRYGATDIINELEIDEEVEYKDGELIMKLNNAGYYEFNPKTTNFAFNQERGLMAVTIQGNSKG